MWFFFYSCGTKTMENSALHITVLLFMITFARSEFIPSSGGEDVQCVDRENQRAFSHPLLKNHKFQETPSEIPTSITRRRRKWKTRQADVSIADCPQGTVPMRKDDVGVITDDDRLHEYAIRSMETTPKLYGTKTTMNVWEPKIENANEMSISQIWLTSGDYKTNDLNTIEVGWQVYPAFYLDNRTRLFLFWTSDAYNATGCYNLRCPGFIQTSSSIVLGGPISPISAFEGDQFELTVFVWKDRKSGNWWLSLGPNNTLVGYWPGEIFTKLADHATEVQWGGEITNARMFGRHTHTEMGSGRFPDEGYGKASYFRNIEIIDDKNNSLQSVQNIEVHVNNRRRYDIKNQFTDDWGSHFFYGGPGFSRARSGVVRLSLCSSLFYFCVGLFFLSFISSLCL